MNPTGAPEVVINPVLMAALFIVGIGSLICWVMEVIAAFKKEEKPLMGILSIVLCSLGGFIIGWIHSKKWGIQKVMIIWSVLFILGIVLNIVFTLSTASMAMDSMPTEGISIEGMPVDMGSPVEIEITPAP